MSIENVENQLIDVELYFKFIFSGLIIKDAIVNSLKAKLKPVLEHLIEVDSCKTREPIDLLTLEIKEDNEIFHILRMMREAVVLGKYELLPIIATHNRFVTLIATDEKYSETSARYSSSEDALDGNERLDELKGAGLIMDVIENIAEAILPFSGLRDSTLKGINYDNGRLIARSLKALTNLDVLVTNLYKSTLIDSEEAKNFLSEEDFKKLLSNVISSVNLGVQNLFNPIQLTIKVAHFICLIKDKKNSSYIGRNAIKVYALNIIDNLYNPKATNHNVSWNGDFNNIAPNNFEDLGEAVNLLLPILELMNEQEMVKRIKRASVLYNNSNIIKKNKEGVFKSLHISYREAALNMIEAINQLGGEEQNYLDSRIEHIRGIVSDQIKDKEHIQLQNHRAKGIYSLIEKILKYYDNYSTLSVYKPFTVEWLKVVLPKVSDLFGVQLIYNPTNKNLSNIPARMPRMLRVKLFKALNFEEDDEDDDDENKNIENYKKAIESLKKQLITIFGKYFFEDPRGDNEAKPEIKLINIKNNTLKDFRNLAFILQITYNDEIIPVEIQVFFGENAFFLGSYGEASHFMYKLMAMANSNPLTVEQSGILNQSVYEFGAMFMKDDESQNAA